MPWWDSIKVVELSTRFKKFSFQTLAFPQATFFCKQVYSSPFASAGVKGCWQSRHRYTQNEERRIRSEHRDRDRRRNRGGHSRRGALRGFSVEVKFRLGRAGWQVHSDYFFRRRMESPFGTRTSRFIGSKKSHTSLKN